MDLGTDPFNKYGGHTLIMMYDGQGTFQISCASQARAVCAGRAQQANSAREAAPSYDDYQAKPLKKTLASKDVQAVWLPSPAVSSLVLFFMI